MRRSKAKAPDASTSNISSHLSLSVKSDAWALLDAAKSATEKLARGDLLEAVLPTQEAFPYVIRLESNILESNGSSSMASVCGGCLALMDAGVPIKRPVSGIAMGLILEGNHFAILSDILGDEDALGDMDFKIAGDHDGISAFQMDIKIEGITPQIMKAALAQAKQGRLHILSKMLESSQNLRTTSLNTRRALNRFK